MNKNFAIGIGGVALLLSAIIVQAGAKFLLSSEVKLKNYLHPPVSIKYFTLGYDDFTASSLWLRLSQDFIYCENGRITDEDIVVVSASNANDALGSVLSRRLKPSKCHEGWVYQMLNVITELEPHFDVAYTLGATFLSVAVDDREGARIIFEKGLKQFPRNWELNFRAGYHYLWEIQDAKRAAELLEASVKYGAPKWVAALSANLYSSIGQAQLAKVIILDALSRKPDKYSQERLQYRLQQVNEIIEKNQKN